MTRGLFDTDPFLAAMGGLFGAGVYAEPPDSVPLRILKIRSGSAGAVTRDKVRSAFRARVFEAHPDLRSVYTDPGLRAAAEVVASEAPDVQELVWARDVLLRMIPEPVTGGRANGIRISTRHEIATCKVCAEPHTRKRPVLYGRNRWAGYCYPCARDAENERHRELRRRARTDLRCDPCGEPFTPPRADGRYCSAACRQKAYRARKAATS
jgi:hypothetical protein